MDEKYFGTWTCYQVIDSNIFSDSVLGRFAEYRQSVKSWTDKIEWFTHSALYRELDRIDGEAVVFEWKIFPGHTTLKLLSEVRNMMEKELAVLPKDFKDRIIFMSMYKDSPKKMKKFVNVIPQGLPKMPKVFPKDTGHSSDLDLKKMVGHVRL